MIEFRLETFEEKLLVSNWMKSSFQYVATIENRVFLAEESGKLLGTCVFSYEKDAKETALIQSIYIIPEERRKNLGDGLIRSTLHFLERQGIKNVKFLSNGELEAFYSFEGFDRHSKNLFVTKLPDFFLRPCKGSGK